ALLGLVCPEPLVHFFAPNFSAEQADLTVIYMRTTMCILLFNSVIVLMEAFLQYKGIFLPQIILGYTQSTSIIIFIIVSAYTSHYYLAYGVLVGYIIRSICTLILAKKNQFHYSPDLHLTEVTRTIVALALPIFIGGSVSQINAFVDKTLASGLAEGTVAALNYANLITGMIQMLTATILVTLIYPKLTQAHALEDYDRVNGIMERGTSLVFIIAAPCTLGAMMYSAPVIQAVYERGAFDASASALTAPAFFGYAVGILFVSMNLLLTRLYYSMGNMKTPVTFGIISAGVNITLNLLLVGPLQQGGLALATSIAAGVNTIQLYLGLRKRYPQIHLLRSKRKVVKILASTAVSVAISRVVYGVLIGIEAIPGLISLGLAVCVAAVVYLALLIVCKIEEVKLINDLFHRG
ncbi:MAG: polysaccharide biosynthesis C-terminal domain-containing protein, partial [Firmicutes bacterium]|nr:polysaccharide biosynthesis C-terminal domain-containing protein [Bacillota bacterium]